jgi:hypothetical protein
VEPGTPGRCHRRADRARGLPRGVGPETLTAIAGALDTSYGLRSALVQKVIMQEGPMRTALDIYLDRMKEERAELAESPKARLTGPSGPVSISPPARWDLNPVAALTSHNIDSVNRNSGGAQTAGAAHASTSIRRTADSKSDGRGAF